MSRLPIDVVIDDDQSTTMKPVNVSYHESTTIQTHNAVSVATVTNSTESVWHDASGYTSLSLTLMNSAATTSQADVYWSNDGSTIHGADYTVCPSNTNQNKSGNISIRARYFKVNVYNGNTASNTMSAWAYLMA